MIQEIITYCILILTFAILGIRILKFFRNPMDKCQTCLGREQGCKLQELRKKV